MRKKAVLIGKGYWGSILQNYIYKDYQLIAIFGKHYTETGLLLLYAVGRRYDKKPSADPIAAGIV